MYTATLKVIYDRKSGDKISEEISDVIKVDNESYYDPFVKLIGDSYLKKISIAQQEAS